MFLGALLLAVALLTVEKNGMTLAVEADREVIDPARSVFVTLRLTAPADIKAELPDLRERLRGFSLAEEFEEPVATANNGASVRTVNWRLVPEPCAAVYKIAPMLVKASPRLLSSVAEDGKFSFVAGPIKFAPPPAPEPVTGAMEVDPQKDLPPLSWRLVGKLALALAALLALVYGGYRLLRLLANKVREHRMSPIERAWVELDRLLKKGLPGRGRYKDFYVELTMVVRRYVQRKYELRAPQLTTEEFFEQLATLVAGDSLKAHSAELRQFLESADLVKFAGVEATPEMAEAATEGARTFLRSDAAPAGKEQPS